MTARMSAWVLREPGPIGTKPLQLDTRPVPDPGPHEVRLRVDGVRRLSDRPAPRRGRPPGAPARGGARAPGGRGGRRDRRPRRPLLRRRSGRGRLAAADLRAVPLVPDRRREPLPEVVVHGLGRRRRLRAVRRRAGRLRLPAARRDRRPAGRSAAVRRHHRVSRPAARGPAAGRATGHLRVRLERPHRRAGRPRLRSRGLRDDQGSGQPGPCPSSRGDLGGRTRGPTSQPARLGRHLRPGRGARPAGPGGPRARRDTRVGRDPHEPGAGAGLRPTSLPGEERAVRDVQHPGRRGGVAAARHTTDARGAHHERTPSTRSTALCWTWPRAGPAGRSS